MDSNKENLAPSAKRKMEPLAANDSAYGSINSEYSAYRISESFRDNGEIEMDAGDMATHPLLSSRPPRWTEEEVSMRKQYEIIPLCYNANFTNPCSCHC